MKHFLLYGYGGACNHGSEAAIKGDLVLLKKLYPDCKITLSTHYPDYDEKFGVEADEIIGRNMEATTYEEMYADTINSITKDTICLSCGGDIYCYNNWERYAIIHNEALKRGAKSYLWRCSLEPDSLKGNMLKVVGSHHAIVARESFTANALLKCGVKNVVLSADMAFLLPTLETDVPKEKYVVFNLSPLILKKNANILKEYQIIADKIVGTTDLTIVLLPHVEISMDNDIDALNQLVIPENRVFRAPIGLKAEQYKYIVSKAEAVMTARTHVAIAGLSSSVPTLVLSYSIKSKGIADDLNQGQYAIDIYNLKDNELSAKFFDVMKNREQIYKELLEANEIVKKRVDSKEILALL